MGRMPDPGTVRWYVSDFVRRHYHGATPVLEIGACSKPGQWWRDFRQQLDVDPADWVGLDMQPGHGVDVVHDLTRPAPGRLVMNFGTVVCAEVLEHVDRPRVALRTMFNMLRPGGVLIVTTPFAFPVHNFPDDYWRFTPSGMRSLLTGAGFTQIHTEEMNHQDVWLFDHSGDHKVNRLMPMHVGAVAVRPE